MNDAKQKEINSLKGEIEAKQSALVASQITYERQLKNGMGDEMIKVLSQHEVQPRKSVWRKLKQNLKKIMK